MKYAGIILLAASSCAFPHFVCGQDRGNAVFYQSSGAVGVVGVAPFEKTTGTAVQGAPYSATVTNESIQTLSDGNRIVHTSTGIAARDLLGRTRQDMAMPPIGNLSVANAPHIGFIRDPVEQVSYTLNLTEKTAQKMPMLSGGMGGATAPGLFLSGGPVTMNVEAPGSIGGSLPVPPPMPLPPGPVTVQKWIGAGEPGQVRTEDLGSQTMEGVFVTGVRNTQTIPAGQVGNDKPIDIVSEVWTSPELKTVIYSKRNDPRMGEQTFRLTNIVRTEPDQSLFTVPADFKIVDGPQPIIYRTNP